VVLTHNKVLPISIHEVFAFVMFFFIVPPHLIDEVMQFIPHVGESLFAPKENVAVAQNAGGGQLVADVFQGGHVVVALELEVAVLDAVFLAVGGGFHALDG
jgi:hypothetical protein